MAGFRIAFDRDCCQTAGPFNQLKLMIKRVTLSATVHFQGADLCPACTKDAAGKEDVQPKERGVPSNFCGIHDVVFGQRNERNHVPDLAIEGGTDFIKNPGNGRSDGNRPKYLLFRFEQVLNLAFRMRWLPRNQPSYALAET